MAELDATKEGFWRTRYSIIAMCFAATFVCYIDRVNISVAIIPMAEGLIKYRLESNTLVGL